MNKEDVYKIIFLVLLGFIAFQLYGIKRNLPRTTDYVTIGGKVEIKNSKVYEAIPVELVKKYDPKLFTQPPR